MNFNKVLIGGRLTRDPDLRYTPSGSPVVDLGIAVNRFYNDKSGQRQKDTCFVDVVLWQKQAELCHKYLKKGSPIFIEGRLSFETWEGRDGERRSKLKVIGERMQFVDGGGSSEGREEYDGNRSYQSAPSPAASYAEPAEQEQQYNQAGPGGEASPPPASDLPF